MFEGKAIDPKKVAVYIRWSTDEQGQGTTLDVQKEACEHFVKSQGWEFIEGLVYIDDGYSGGNMVRPELTRLRNHVQEGLVEAVVVYKIDRLSRNLLDCVTLVRQEWGDKCSLFSTRENLDTHSSVGQMVFNILVSFAEFERNVIRERTLSGKHKRAEQGRNAGQRYPYGYKRGDSGEWALDGWDAAQECLTGKSVIVRRIFDEYLAGLGTTSIARGLRHDGIPAPAGGLWQPGAVARILANRIYSGVYEYGMREGKKRKIGAPKYRAETVPPIVTKEEFERAQELRKQRANESPRKLGSDYLLSGVAVCGRCGHAINGSSAHGKRYYVCAGRKTVGVCDCASMNADLLEEAFIAQVQDVITTSGLDRLVMSTQSGMEQRKSELRHAESELERQISKHQAVCGRLYKDYADGAINGEQYSNLLGATEGYLSEAQEKLQGVRGAMADLEAVELDVVSFSDKAHLLEAWNELTVEETRQIIRDITDSLSVYQAKVESLAKRSEPNQLMVEWRPRLSLSTSQDAAAD